MAKRRTLKEKKQASLRYQPSYTLEVTSSTVQAVAQVNGLPVTDNLKRAFGVVETDTYLIKKDIIKSVIMAMIIISLEFGIYWYWFR